MQHRAAAPKNLTAAQVQNLQPQDPDLTCSIDNKLLREAVTTPCCGTSFCKSCIEQHLSKNDFVCPECDSKVKSLDKLKPDQDRRVRVADYVDEMVRSSKTEEEKPVEDASSETEPAATSATTSADVSRCLSAKSTVSLQSTQPSGSPSAESSGKLALPSDDTKNRSTSPSGSTDQPSATSTTTATSPADGGAMAAMMSNPMMWQQQMMQLTMVAQNPMLPPPARMQASMMLQQMQMQMQMMGGSSAVGGMPRMNNAGGPPPDAPKGPGGGRRLGNGHAKGNPGSAFGPFGPESGVVRGSHKAARSTPYSRPPAKGSSSER